MTIFMCKTCSPERPCFFDNNSTDDVKPDSCPIEDYQHGAWVMVESNKSLIICTCNGDTVNHGKFDQCLDCGLPK